MSERAWTAKAVAWRWVLWFLDNKSYLPQIGLKNMWIVFWILFAVLVGVYGKRKGIGFGGPFVLSLLLSPLIGFIITAFRKPGNRKKCVYCTEMIQKEAKICHYCGKEQPKEQPIKEIEKGSRFKDGVKLFLTVLVLFIVPFFMMLFTTVLFDLKEDWWMFILFWLFLIVVAVLIFTGSIKKLFTKVINFLKNTVWTKNKK